MSTREIIDTIFELLQAPDAIAATNIINANDCLLQEKTNLLLTGLIANGCKQENLAKIAQFTTVRGLLSRCQKHNHINTALHNQQHWPLVDNLPLEKLDSLNENISPQQRIAYANLAMADYQIPLEKEELEIYAYVNFHLGWGYHMLAKAGNESAREKSQKYLWKTVELLQPKPSKIWPQLLPFAQLRLAYQLLRWPSAEQYDRTEKAIEFLEEARKALSQDKIHYIDALISLGNAYMQRLEPERVNNIETGISFYQDALKQPLGLDTRGIELHHNLAVAYRKRLVGLPENNFQKANEHAQTAINLAKKIDDRVSMGRTYAELATLYAHYQGTDRDKKLEDAIQFSDNALDCFPLEEYPYEWGLVQLILGNLYCDRIKGKHGKNLKEAIDCFTAVSARRSPEKDPLGWAEVQNNLGTVYAELSRSANDSHYRQAITCFEQVTTICEKEQNFAFARLAAANLGFLAFRYAQWEESLAALNRAIVAGENLFGASFSEVGKRVELADSSRLSPAAAYCLLQLKRPLSALIQLEQGKTRQLAEALALHNLDLQQFPEEQRDSIIKLRQEIRGLEDDLRPSTKTSIDPDTPVRTKVLQKKRQALQKFTKAHSALTGDDILALIPANGALIAPVITTQGSAIFILQDGLKAIEEDNVLWLNDFTEITLQHLFRDVQEKEFTQTTHTLWNSLMCPIHQRLSKFGVAQEAHIRILPQGGLGILPLHAAKPRNAHWTESFAANYIISYAPSAYVLQKSIARGQTAVSKPQSLLAIINPTEDLISTEGELDSLLSNFPDEIEHIILQGEAATKTAVINKAATHSYLHFACHGAYDWKNVMDSHLLLANGERLTLASIIEDLKLQETQLVTLSACETGITDLKQVPDEYLGLPGGFIQAGAPRIISTLWPVNDASAAIFMDQFYKHHIGGNMSPAEALHATQLWFMQNTSDGIRDYYDILREEALRQDKNSQKYLQLAAAAMTIENPNDPYHWAAFVFSGS